MTSSLLRYRRKSMLMVKKFWNTKSPIETLKAHEAKSTCVVQFLTLTWRTLFYIAIQAWKPKRSRSAGKRKMGRMVWLVHEGDICSVKPARMVFSDNESSPSQLCWGVSYTVTWCAIYSTHTRFWYHHGRVQIMLYKHLA